MTATYTESEVPGNCTVRVVSVSGQCVLSTTIEEPKEILLLSFSLVAVCAKKLNVPRLCLHLVWPRIRRSITDPEPLVLEVQLVMTEIRLWTRLLGQYECDLCFDPCDDASDFDNVQQENELRDFNCRRCQSPTMCLIAGSQQIPTSAVGCVFVVHEKRTWLFGPVQVRKELGGWDADHWRCRCRWQKSHRAIGDWFDGASMCC